MKKERRKFDKEYKIMAVDLCLSGKPTSEVAEELGLPTELVARWKRGGGRPNTNREKKAVLAG